MTVEEAIKVCTREKECVQSALNACADGGHYVSPDGIITATDYVEAMDMAIAALREQCVRDATKTSGDAVTDSHQLETVTNRNGLNCIGIEAINRLESDTVKVVDSDQFKTNADHIRSMTDEELAETIVREFCAVSDNTIEFIVAKTRFRLWLKQPYKENA